jgi:hypothetical protein
MATQALLTPLITPENYVTCMSHDGSSKFSQLAPEKK